MFNDRNNKNVQSLVHVQALVLLSLLYVISTLVYTTRKDIFILLTFSSDFIAMKIFDNAFDFDKLLKVRLKEIFECNLNFNPFATNETYVFFTINNNLTQVKKRQLFCHSEHISYHSI